MHRLSEQLKERLRTNRITLCAAIIQKTATIIHILPIPSRTSFVIVLTNYSMPSLSVFMPTNHTIVIHSINGAHPNFDPVDLAIAVGDTVTWRNDDAGLHTASSTIESPVFFDSEDIDPNGGEYSFTFNEAVESAPYECLYHQSMMKGTIAVQ
jgi:plastocyanin